MNAEDIIVAQLTSSVKQLMVYCSSLKEENDRLLKEISIREEELQNFEQEIENLKADISNLKFVKAVHSSGDEHVEEAKKKLMKLVRDVDKCISLLR